MEDAAIRIECLKAAVACQGNPNHTQLAREFYEFVTENVNAAPTVEEVSADQTPAAPKKGARK